MIKALSSDPKRPILFLGLSEKNCELLLSGMPIMIKKEEVNILYDICIFGGKDESSLLDFIKDGITDKTILH